MRHVRGPSLRAWLGCSLLTVFNGAPISDWERLGVTKNDPTVSGKPDFWFPLGAWKIGAKQSFTICHSRRNVSKGHCNATWYHLSNGNDGICLAKGTKDHHVLVDCVGHWNGNPGDTGWRVCDKFSTRDTTIIRKCGIINGTLCRRV